MNAALDPAVARFTRLQQDDEEEAELWRGKLQAFRNLYGFLSQVIPYQDSDLEALRLPAASRVEAAAARERARATSSMTKCGSNTTACRKSAKARSA